MWDNRIGKFFRVLFVHTHRLPLEAEKWNENNQFPLFNTSRFQLEQTYFLQVA